MGYNEIADALAGTIGYYIFFGVLGAVIGSFSGVLIYRLPEKRSIQPRSRCNSCEYEIPWYRNLPIVSWIIQGGKCANCKVRISASVLTIEVLSIAGYLLAAWLTQDPVAGLAYAMVITFSLVLGAIDWKTSYVHLGVAASFGGAAWLLTILWGGLSNAWSSVILGLGIGIGWWVFLEVINGLYYLIRKRHGLGGGDGMMMMVTCGVAAGLSGSWIVGLYGGFLGFVLGVFGVLIPMLRGAEPVPQVGDEEEWEAAKERGEEIEYDFAGTPIAYGPFLMAGPVLIWVLMKLIGMV